VTSPTPPPGITARPRMTLPQIARAATAAALAITAATVLRGTAATPADITAAALWWAITSQPELAPARRSHDGRQPRC
jgi:hypothetical protein